MITRRPTSRLATIIALALFAAAVTPDAQSLVRRAAAIASLVTFPGFFHGQPVLVRGTLTSEADGLRLTSPGVDKSIHLVFRGASPPDGPVELRATFWDLGRLEAADARVAGEGLEGFLRRIPEGDWPSPGELLVLAVTDAVAVSPSEMPPTVHSIALDPGSYVGRRVTIVGQFRGRNLYGDLPQAPGLSQWDFVLSSADAAIWVTGQRPRGRDFDLNVTARVDTGRWLEVSGVVQQARGLVWLEDPKIALAKPPVETTAVEIAPPPVGPAPEVIFSDPSDGESDVSLKKIVRLQFSRDMNPRSFTGRVRWSYRTDAGQPGQLADPPKLLTPEYIAANRALELRLEVNELSRLRRVTIELDEGITAVDGAVLQPWHLTFTFGGS